MTRRTEHVLMAVCLLIVFLFSFWFLSVAMHGAEQKAPLLRCPVSQGSEGDPACTP